MFPRKISTMLAVAIAVAACSSETPEEVNTQHLERAKAYQTQGQFKAATIEYRNAIKKSGGALDSVVLYADMLNDIGQYEAARELLLQLKSGQDDAYWLELIEANVALRKYQSARAALKSVSSDSIKKQILNAQIVLGEEQFDKAALDFKKIVESSSASEEERAEGLFGLATVASREGNFEAALGYLAKISQESHVHARAQLIKAGVEIVRGDLPGAEATLSEVLSQLPNTDIMQPDKAVVLERLAYVLTRLGRANEAFIYQKLLAEAFPGANEVNDNYNKALEAFQEKDFDTAKSALKDILNDYPTHDKAKQLLGVISYLEGDTQSASEYLDESVDPEVADSLTRHVYAATSLKLNDPKKVIEILEPQIHTTESASTLALYGLAAISDGQGEKGEKALLKAADIEPEDVRVRLALASYYRNAAPTQSDKELAQLNAAYAIAPTEEQVLTDFVSYYARSDSQAAARGFVDKALAKHPKAYGTNLVAAYMDASERKLETSLEKFDRALAAKSQVRNYSKALYAKARIEFELERFDSAEKSLMRLVSDYPDNDAGYRALHALYVKQKGDAAADEKLLSLASQKLVLEPYLALIDRQLAKGDMAKADEYFEQAQKLGKGEAQLRRTDQGIRLAKASEAMRIGEYESARKQINSLLVESPESARLISMLIDIDIRDEKFAQAEEAIERLESLPGTSHITPVLQGDLAFERKNLEGAKRHYRNAWLERPSNAVGDKLLRVYSRLNDEKGRQQFQKEWLEKIPNSPKPMLLQAMQFQERGLKIKAREAYEALLKIQPNNVPALNNLGWLLFEKGDFTKSEKNLRQALALAPGSPAVLDSLGWILHKSGRSDEGLVHLEKAADLAPDSKEILAHLEEVRAAN